MRNRNVAFHVLHLTLPLALFALFDGPIVVAVASVLFFFAVFALFHDALHGALGARRTVNDAVLTLAGALIGVAGHAARVAHLKHHATPFAPDDPEGRGARGPLPLVLLRAPRAYLSMPADTWRRLRRDHRLVALEWTLVAVIAACAALTPGMRIPLAITLGAQLSIPVWASRWAHDPPAWMVIAARPFAWTRSPLVLGLLFHERHHDAPRLGMYELPDGYP